MFGWVGILVGLVGIAVAVYFGLTSRRRRELLFSVNPVRTKVVTSGQATDLKVSYRDEPLGDTDVTAVQLAIWNAGYESIKKGHIRKEIVVTTKPQVRILEASVRTGSPDTGFNLLDSTDSKVQGRVPVSWEILERNEGASIQLLYLGTSEVDILVEGLIEGQGHPKQIVTSSSLKSPQEHLKTRRQQSLWVVISLVFSVVTAILQFAINVQWVLVPELFIISSLSLFLAILSLSVTIREQFPPFWF